MHIHTNNKEHLSDFIRLNEIWITEYFALEEADKTMAANPAKIIDDGGFVFSVTQRNKVVGVCALFKESPQRYELARMAVEPRLRGRGYGRALLEYALKHAKSVGATSVYLYSNTVLEPAIALYKQFGFTPIAADAQRTYARGNIVMERAL